MQPVLGSLVQPVLGSVVSPGAQGSACVSRAAGSPGFSLLVTQPGENRLCQECFQLCKCLQLQFC